MYGRLLVARGAYVGATLLWMLLAPLRSTAAEKAYQPELGRIAKQVLIKLCKGKSFDVKGTKPRFVGKISAIDPATHGLVEFRRIAFDKTAASLDVTVKSRFRVAGKGTIEGETIALDAVVDASLSASGRARVATVKGKLVLQSKLSKVEIKVVVKKLTPNNIQGGPEFVSEVVNKFLKDNNAGILKAINREIAMTPIAPQKLIEKRIHKELSRRATKQTGFFNERNSTEAVQIRIGGRRATIKLKLHTKSWIWLHQPDKRLVVKLRRLHVKNGRWSFALSGQGKIKAHLWAKINLAQAKTGADSTATLSMSGSFALDRLGRITQTKIDVLQGTLSKTRFDSPLTEKVKPYIERAMNKWLKKQSERKLKSDLAKALDGQKLF